MTLRNENDIKKIAMTRKKIQLFTEDKGVIRHRLDIFNLALKDLTVNDAIATIENKYQLPKKDIDVTVIPTYWFKIIILVTILSVIGITIKFLLVDKPQNILPLIVLIALGIGIRWTYNNKRKMEY